MLFVVLLAMIAAFLALRLYSVLGKRTGHEQPLPKPAKDRVAQQPGPRTIDMPADLPEAGPRSMEDAAERGIRAIAASDSSFEVNEFVEGSRSAYRMILEAYWKGDRETLEWLVDGDVKSAFVDAIDQREADGHVIDNRLVVIERALISDASVEGRVARITVRFDADIAGVTRDADGNIVAGSMTDAVETHDVWTFARELDHADPNWKLSETDEA